MNHHDTAAWPLWASWAANGVIWMTAGMSPLQVLALLITIGYTVHRWWRWYHSARNEP